MSFVRSVAEQYPEIPVVWVQRNNVVTNTGNTTVQLPASGNFTPVGISRGVVRVKTNVVGVNATSRVFSITAIDSTNASNKIELYSGDQGVSAVGVGIDHEYAFQTDIQIGVLNVIVNVNTNNCTTDVEVAGTQ